MNDHTLSAQRFQNTFQSLLLIGGMLLLLGVLKHILAGSGGLLLLLFMGAVLLFFSPRFSPRLLLRLYRASPMDRGAAPGLFDLVGELSRRAELRTMPELFYIPSHLINAITVGTRRNPVIAMTDGLLRSLNSREMTGVLAHEIAHVRHNDIWVMGLADVIGRLTGILSLLGQILLFFYLVSLPFQQGFTEIPWLALLLLIFAPTLSALLQLALSRTREFNADLGAVELTGDALGLASALQKMEQSEASLLERLFLPGRRIPEPSLLRTHPATKDRIERLLELVRTEEEPIAHEPEWLPNEFLQARSPHHHRPRWHVHGLWY